MKTPQISSKSITTLTMLAITFIGLSSVSAQGDRRDATKGATQQDALLMLKEDGGIILRLGEQRVFNLKDVSKMTIEDDSMLGFRSAGREASEITLLALQVGLTTITVSGRGEPLNRYVRIYAATPESVIKDAQRAGKLNVQSACLKGARLGNRQFRLVIDPKGRVTTAQIDQRDDIDAERYKCLTQSARAWRFNTQDKLLYTVGLISIEL